MNSARREVAMRGGVGAAIPESSHATDIRLTFLPCPMLQKRMMMNGICAKRRQTAATESTYAEPSIRINPPWNSSAPFANIPRHVACGEHADALLEHRWKMRS